MSLFVRKDLQALLAEAGAGTLKRELGPLALVTLGIGAVIGAGIFVYTGIVASQNAGPALTLSMVLAGIACAFAGLCYAELASMIPVAGSAYTYAYATMGELIAWIIGWDLVLEYSLSSSSVAVGWSGYAVILLGELGITVPPRLTGAPGTAVLLPDGSWVTAWFNLPAVVVCLAITALLVIGIRESARVNTTIVIVKVAVLALFVIVGARYVNTANLHPFIPPNTGQFGSFGWSGILRGAGIIFFAYIGFDAVSTASQEAKNPGRDIPIGILVSLAICTIIYISVGLVMTERDTGQSPCAVPDILFHESRRTVAAGFREVASTLPHSACDDGDHRCPRCHCRGTFSDRCSRPAGEHGDASGFRDRLHWSPNPAQSRAGRTTSIQDPRHALGSHRRNSHLLLPDVGFAARDLDQVIRLARDWARDLLRLRTIQSRGVA